MDLRYKPKAVPAPLGVLEYQSDRQRDKLGAEAAHDTRQ